MQVYMWNDIPSLNSYNNGVAVSLASSLEEAVELVVNFVKLQGETDQGFWFDNEALAQLKLELETLEYQVHTGPMGFALWPTS